jgi:hypothetical protein
VRFRGYDVMAQRESWDETTTAVVLRRLQAQGTPRFFSVSEEPIVRALLDHLLAQDAEPRVPVFEMIDARLAEDQGDGYHHADLPRDPAAWRWSLQELDAEAREQSGVSFRDLDSDSQRDLIEDVRLADDQWRGIPASHLFALWMRYACAAFYSHPWAWNEIGFGGPAYPRGYKHLAFDGREPWEVKEVDAHDPIPWAERSENAKKSHAEGLSARESSSDEGGA